MTQDPRPPWERPSQPLSPEPRPLGRPLAPAPGYPGFRDYRQHQGGYGYPGAAPTVLATPPLRPGRVAVVAVMAVIALIGSAFAGATIARSSAPTSTTASADRSGARTKTAPPTSRVPRSTPSTQPSNTPDKTPPELSALRGRPAELVTIDAGLCAAPLQPGALYPRNRTGWNPDSAADPVAKTENETKAEIATIMRRRFRNQDPDRAVAEAMAIYDADAVKTFTKDEPALRAALAELKGTIGEPVIKFVLTTNRPISVVFGKPSVDEAGAETRGDGFSMQITFRDEFTNEYPALLAPILFHELLHQGGAAFFDEELLNNVLNMRVMLEMLRDFPEELSPPTELARETRWSSLAQLNNRVGTDMTLTRSDAETLFPNTMPISGVGTLPKNLIDLLHGNNPSSGASNPYSSLPSDPTPGSTALTEVLQLMGPDSPSPADFDDTTIAFVDTHPGVSECDQLIAAEALGVLGGASPSAKAAAQYIKSLPE